MGRRVYAYDAVLIVWTAIWLAVGAIVYRDVRDLTGLSDPVVDAAAALEETAQGLRQIDGIPFVGDVTNLPAIERDVRAAAASARASARDAEENVRRLAIVLGLSLAFIPTLPPLALWVAVRREWRRRL